MNRIANSKALALLLLSSMLMPSACKKDKNNEGYKYEEVGALKNYLEGLDLKGYLGTNLKNNIKYWQKDAYEKNPNIIEQIAKANEGSDQSSLSEVLGSDYFGVDGYYDIDVVDTAEGKKIGWKLKYVPGSFGDRDLRYCNDINATTNWGGAKELWIRLDNREIGQVTSVRVCFEDDLVGAESYSLRKGSVVKLYSSAAPVEVSVQEGGYVDIPGSFHGYLSLPLDNDHYEMYWISGGNSRIDLGNVAQFQIAVKGSAASINKNFYMDDFSIVGGVIGDDLPFSIQSDYKIKRIWDINKLSPRNQKEGYEPSSLAWYGEFVGKLLTGIAFSYKATRDESLKIEAETIISLLKDAQGKDGYLGTYKGGARYSINSSNWDLWNHYHCIVGLLEWHKNTGNKDALSIAKKAIDLIYETFKGRSYLVRGGFETNRGIAHGYAIMYQVTNDKKYLNEAIRIIENDCHDGNGWYITALAGGNFYRSSSPRWEVLHMIMTLGILYEETGEEEYYDVMEKVWYDILHTDIHNTGGFTTNEAAIGNPYTDGVIETCCTIAWQAFTNEFYKYSKNVEVIDELERSYFNGLLGALTDDDAHCTYNTPMNGYQGSSGGYDGRRVKSQQDISFQYNSGSKDMNCCQANFARGIGQISEWACLVDGGSVYLNYYGESNIKTKVLGKSVTISEKTSYPNDGNIALTISNLKNPTKFKLKLRIPSWAKGGEVSYDGDSYNAPANDYFEIEKTWKNGDSININLDMGFTFWKGERSQAGYASLYYGPVLYALDEYHLGKAGSSIPFDRTIAIDKSSLANIKPTNGNKIGCISYVDVGEGESLIRLVDFASAGKYNGKAQPSSYYSWIKINNLPSVDNEDFVNIWKNELI